jgi:tRNA pseudouridine38-40 synthase
LLPPSIRILALRPASPAFHARYDARAKEYRYRIWNAPVASPLECRTALHVRAPLDLAAMRAAAAYLVGTHDFAAFSANPHRETSGTTRTIFSLTITRRGPLITLSVTGNGFLYKMVRSIAGYLVRVGRHAIPAAETPSILTSLTRTARVETAPPHALLLHRIYYSPLSPFPPPSHP